MIPLENESFACMRIFRFVLPCWVFRRFWNCSNISTKFRTEQNQPSTEHKTDGPIHPTVVNKMGGWMHWQPAVVLELPISIRIQDVDLHDKALIEPSHKVISSSLSWSGVARARAETPPFSTLLQGIHGNIHLLMLWFAV